jgi:hypothetical protein
VTTKSDLARYDKLHRIGCVACRKKGLGWRAVDIHHIVDRGYRKHSGGNRATLPLCEYHHRGVPAEGFLNGSMYLIYGPSLALQKREFKRVFGDERQLLAEVDQLIESMVTA